MNDNPLLKTPGEMISEAREARDLTLAQLSERTKIPPPVLSALELDEYHKISGPLYIKSFLRTCATDLGLDPQVVLDQYNKISGEKEAGPVGAEMVWSEDEVKISRVGLPWVRIMLAGGVLVLLVGLLLFALRGCRSGGSGPDAEQSPAVVQTLPVAVGGDSASLGKNRRESMMPRATEQELRQLAREAAPETTIAPGGAPSAGSQLPDTLALGWLMNPDPPVSERGGRTTGPASDDVAEKQVPPSGGEAAAVVETHPQETRGADAAQVEIRPERSPVAEGIGQVDSSWPLVLGISCDRPLEILVRRDGDRDFRPVKWPAESAEAPPLPAAGFEAGRAYRKGNRLVVFWGAEDHFSLKLDRVRGVEVTVNGRVRDVSRLRPGQELILDAQWAGRSSGR